MQSSESDESMYANQTLLGLTAETWILGLVLVDITNSPIGFLPALFLQAYQIFCQPAGIGSPHFFRNLVENSLYFLSGLGLSWMIGGTALYRMGKLELVLNQTVLFMQDMVKGFIRDPLLFSPLNNLVYTGAFLIFGWSVYQVLLNMKAGTYRTDPQWAWARSIQESIERFIRTVRTLHREGQTWYDAILKTIRNRP